MSDNIKNKEYHKDDLTITWEPEKCIHSKLCWQELHAVFKPLKRPWVNTDGASQEEIINQINKCPSGALGYYLKNENIQMSEEIQATEMTEIKVNKNGSMRVSGPVKIIMPDGTETVKEGKFGMCRCGLSANKPFCDGSHKDTGFDNNWEIETV